MNTQIDNARRTGEQHRVMGGVIAVVDENSEAVSELEALLVGAGFAVCRYERGDTILQSLVADETDLIIIDVCQDGTEGFELCRQIKRTAALRNIPVVFVSCATGIEVRLNAFRCGGIDYIVSPFQSDEVVARLRTHMSVFHARRELMSVQEELRLSKDSLKLAHAIARLGHWEWEMGSGVVRWSDEAYQILGYQPHDCLPNHEILLQRVHPEEREQVKQQFEQIFERGEGDFDMEFRVTLPDGRSRILHGRGRVVCLMDCRYPHIIDSARQHPQREHTTFIGVIQDVTERKEIEQRLEIEAHTDELTGCASRRYFLEVAKEQITQRRRQQGALSLLMLDLDCFKGINDRNGHHVGDLTLQALADICRQMLRAGDVVGRLGGEEFAVLLPQSPIDVAGDIAERLRRAIEYAVVPLDDGGGVNFTASIGVATLEAEDDDIDALLYRADRALYVAKKNGRNRVCIDGV